MTTAAVMLKHVPVGGAFLRIDGDRLTRDGVPHGADPIDETVLEWALRQREAGALRDVVVICLGAPEAVGTLRRGLAMGADRALLVSDPALAGADVRRTARALAGAVRHVGAELALLGYESLDGSSGAVPAALAAVLDRPLLSRLRTGDLRGRVLRGQRDLGDGPQVVEVDLPAVATFVEGGHTARFPTVRDLIRTSNADVTVLGAADVHAADAPSRSERVTGLRPTPVPPRDPEVCDGASGVERILSLLAEATGGVR